jgi:hypothetical protein
MSNQPVSLADELRQRLDALQAVPASVKVQHKAQYDDAVSALYALASSLEQLQPAESNTNSDQVTITLSRKDAEWLMDISPAYRNINRPGFLEAWGNVRNATRAALHQPQPK